MICNLRFRTTRQQGKAKRTAMKYTNLDYRYMHAIGFLHDSIRWVLQG